MNQEIEIKIQINSEQLKLLKSWLDINAKFVGQLEHEEYYLDNPNDSFLFTAPQGYKDAHKYFRVRLTSNGDSACFKSFYFDENGKATHCDETEIKLVDGKKTLQLLKEIGFTDQTLMHKVRKTFIVDGYEIVIDDVKNLGVFVEIEIKHQVDNVKAGLQGINNLLQKIGITEFQKQERGYVSMLWNPDYDFGEEINL
ncbi:MAG: class IV adenylate cyclase [bacterium]